MLFSEGLAMPFVPRSRAAVAAALAALGIAVVAGASPRESVTFSGVASRERVNDPANEVRTHTFSGGYPVGRLRVNATLTRVQPSSLASESRVRVITPLGRAITLQPFVASSYTTITTDPEHVLILQPAEADPAGVWTFQFYESRNDAAGADATWDSITITLDDDPPPPPPGDQTTAENLGEIGAGTTVNDIEPAWSVYPCVKWYRFDVPVPASPATMVYLDIDSNDTSYGTGNDAVTDTEIALFRSDGTLVGQDDDDGAGLASLLSFGDVSSRPGGYQSQDGNLAAGTYYLAVAPFNATFSAGFGVTTTGTAFPGDIRVRVSSGFTSMPSPPGAIDLGRLVPGTEAPPPENLAPAGVVWYTFELAESAEVSALKYLDADTEGSLISDSTGAGTGNDTMLGLYDAAGNRIIVDDDDGSGRLSQATFGGGSMTPTVGDGMPYEGRDGMLPAGRYYAAVTGFGNTAFGPTGWSVYTEHQKSGTVSLRLHTNTDLACSADFNGDGFLDFFDYDDYVACFEGSGCPPGRDADFNGDGFVDFFDYDEFVFNFETGC
jgi:hypothetical protein